MPMFNIRTMSSTALKKAQKHILSYTTKHLNEKKLGTSVWFVGTKKTTPLGRWDTISNENKDNEEIRNAIEKNIYWANHDHCGGEICKTPNKEDKVEKDRVNIDFKRYENDPMWPFLL